MIKFELPELGMETIIESYSISKKRDDIAVLSTITTKARFGMPDYDTLFRETVEGNTEEEGLVTVFCGQEFEEFEAQINHNKGVYLHKACISEKDIKLTNPFECIKNIEVNIFDYPSENIKKFEGTMEAQVYPLIVKQKIRKPFGTVWSAAHYVMPLNEALDILGGIGPYGSQGYFIESVTISITPQFYAFGGDPVYDLHTIVLVAVWRRIISPTKLSENWAPLPPSEGTGFYYIGLPLVWEGPIVTPTVQAVVYNDQITRDHAISNVVYRYGQPGTYDNVPISNFIDFNKMLEGSFECVEYPLISNFFGINPDGSEPQNEEYAYALSYLQQLRIVQASDIIKSNADVDAFGKSGLIKLKKMLTELYRIFELMLVFDETEDVLRLEHISYFAQKGLNFIAQDIAYELNDEIEVNRENVNKEFFRFAKETPTAGFYQSEIDYQNYTIADTLNEKTEASELFITDYNALLNNNKYDTDEYKKLFFLISTRDGSIIESNIKMSMVNITNALKLTNRYSLRALKDGFPIVFKGYSIGFECEVKFAGSIGLFKKLFPMNTVKLSNGVWLIEEIEYKDSKNMTLKIRK